MSRHPSFRDIKQLSAYLDGELDASAVRRLETRLSRDPGLRAALDELSATRAVLRRTPQRRAPRDFSLTPQMVAKRPPLPRLVPALNYAALTAVLLFFSTFVSGPGFGNRAASAPMLEAVPTGFNIGGMPAEDMAAMPAAEEPALAPQEPADAAIPEAAAEPSAAPAAGAAALPTLMPTPSPAPDRATETEKAVTVTPQPTPTRIPTPLPAPPGAAPLLTSVQRWLLIAAVTFLLAAWFVRLAVIARWQKTSP